MRRTNGTADCNNIQAPNPAAAIAIRFACDQLGEPYVWGGHGELGWDCSGLVKSAYAAAGIDIPGIPRLNMTFGPSWAAAHARRSGSLWHTEQIPRPLAQSAHTLDREMTTWPSTADKFSDLD